MANEPVKFDYAAAKAAGFTDEQIAASLAAKRAKGINVVVDRNEVQAVRSGSAPPMMMTPDANPATQFLQMMRGRTLDALPAFGGMAGGLAAGIPGAAAGGALGEGVREAYSGKEMNPWAIAGQGALQGGLEGAGGLLAKGAGMVARPIMRGAIRASKAIQKGFPDVVETSLEYGLPATKGGVKKAARLRAASAQATEELLAQAKAAGREFDPHDVVAHADAVLNNAALPNEDAAVIANQVANFLDQYKGKIDPVLLQEIKQIYQNRAVPMYAADAAGRKAASMSPQGQFNKALAKGARDQLATIPGVAEQDAITQKLIGAERAIGDATMRHHGRLEIMKPGTYPVVGALGSSAITSRAALLLNSQKFKAIARQSPRLAAALLQQAMSTAEPDATSGQ